MTFECKAITCKTYDKELDECGEPYFELHITENGMCDKFEEG